MIITKIPSHFFLLIFSRNKNQLNSGTKICPHASNPADIDKGIHRNAKILRTVVPSIIPYPPMTKGFRYSLIFSVYWRLADLFKRIWAIEAKNTELSSNNIPGRYSYFICFHHNTNTIQNNDRPYHHLNRNSFFKKKYCPHHAKNCCQRPVRICCSKWESF